MYASRLVFAQVMAYAPWHSLRRLVAKYHGDFNVLSFRCLDQCLYMAFAQLTYRRTSECDRGKSAAANIGRKAVVGYKLGPCVDKSTIKSCTGPALSVRSVEHIDEYVADGSVPRRIDAL
jgi:hypothetical protein